MEVDSAPESEPEPEPEREAEPAGKKGKKKAAAPKGMQGTRGFLQSGCFGLSSGWFLLLSFVEQFRPRSLHPCLCTRATVNAHPPCEHFLSC